METAIEKTIQGIRSQGMQTCNGMTVVPLFLPDIRNSFTYIMLPEALSSGSLIIKEVSEGGSVPELMATNKGDIPVLILDGEELYGAKQNRVANTSILVPPLCTITIPVSCTESGRWTYASSSFSNSDVMMSRNIRAKKNISVSGNLGTHHSFTSNQGEVWAEIDSELRGCGTNSHTSAMKDAHEQLRTSLDEYVKAFSYVAGQQGIMVFIGGEPAGLELLSDPGCFLQVHEKLVRSYAMETIRTEPRNKIPKEDAIHTFLNLVSLASDTRYQSPGLGEDHRLRTDQIAGAVLVHEKQVIHMTIFDIREPTFPSGHNGSQRSSGMDSMKHRKKRMREKSKKE